MKTTLLLLMAAGSLAAQNPDSLYRARKFDEASAVAKAALATNKADHNAMWVLGRIALNNNRSEEAQDWFDKAVKLDDKNAQYHLGLGQAVGNIAQNANKLRQPFLAKKVKHEFERAAQLDPTLIDARQGLADFYQMAPGIMGGSNAKAHEQIAAIRQLNPYRGHFAGARYAARDKDNAGAQKEWEAAIKEYPDSIVPYYQLGGSLRAQQKWDDALAHYEAMYRKFPNEPVPHLAWAITAVQANNHLDKAEKEIKWFLANATVDKVGTGNMSAAHFRLGQIYEKTARKTEARASYEETLKVNPQHADAKKALGALK